MLVTQVSALLAAIPMAAVLSVRGGPGGWGHGGVGHWGGHHAGDHEHHEPEDYEFKIVTYDLTYALEKEYYTLGEEVDDTGIYPLVQTDEENKSGTYEVTKDGYLEFVTPDDLPDLVAFHPETLDLGTYPIPLTFASPDDLPDGAVEWKWDFDHETENLLLDESGTPYYILLCPSEDPVGWYLAVGAVGETYSTSGCVAVHLDTEDDYED